MAEWWTLGPEAKHLVVSRGAMLYDASRAINFSEGWFDPAFWATHGQVDGAAPGRGTTLFVSTRGKAFALRHYYRGGLPGKMLRDSYLYRGALLTRPFREWCLTYQLHRHGLPVPAPVAARFARDGVWYHGDLITERIDGAQSLGARITAGAVSIADWVAVGRCIRRFHDFGLYHADLNANNLLFAGDGRVLLIDFDRSELRARGLWCDTTLVRLRRSLLKITDPLPAGHFTETDWQSLLAGYADARRDG